MNLEKKLKLKELLKNFNLIIIGDVDFRTLLSL